MPRNISLGLPIYIFVLSFNSPASGEMRDASMGKPSKTAKASYLTFDEIRAGVTRLYKEIWAMEAEYIQITEDQDVKRGSIPKMRYGFAFKGEKRMKIQYIGDATEADFTVAFDETRSQHYMPSPSRGRISKSKDTFSDVDAYAYAIGLGLRDAERAATTSGYHMPAALHNKEAGWVVEPQLETIDGAECHVVISNPTNQRMWVDPAIGFAIRYREIRQPVDGLGGEQCPLMTVIKFGSFMETIPGAWLPKHISSIDYIRTRAPKEQWNHVSYTCKFDVTKLKVGSQVSDETFNLKFPKGTTVYDGLKNRTYRVGNANEELDVTVRTGQDFLAKNSYSNKKFYLIGVNIILIAVALGYFVLLYKHRSRSI